MGPTEDFKWPEIPNYGVKMSWRFSSTRGGEHGVVEIVSGGLETVWVERWVRTPSYSGDGDLIYMEDITQDDVLRTAEICLEALKNVVAWTRVSESE